MKEHYPGFLLDISLQLKEEINTLVYPFCLPAFKGLNRLSFHPQVTYLIGENGMGKSTLLEALAIKVGFNPEGGGKNIRFETRPSHSVLHEHLRVAKSHRLIKDGFFLRSESFYNVASQIDSFGPDVLQFYGGTSLHEQSHGESFWSLFMERFFGNGLYILDEPEAALSATRQMAFLSRVHQLVESNAQIIIATHSPIILAYPYSIIYELSEDGINQVEYKESSVYRIFKSFLNNPDDMISRLLDESE